MEAIETKILEILARIAKKDASELHPEQELVADLNLESMHALELLCDVEDELGVEFPDEAVTDMNTVGDVLAIARNQVAAQGA